jgi:hypothetical protein
MSFGRAPKPGRETSAASKTLRLLPPPKNAKAQFCVLRNIPSENCSKSSGGLDRAIPTASRASFALKGRQPFAQEPVGKARRVPGRACGIGRSPPEPRPDCHLIDDNRRFLLRWVGGCICRRVSSSTSRVFYHAPRGRHLLRRTRARVFFASTTTRASDVMAISDAVLLSFRIGRW